MKPFNSLAARCSTDPLKFILGLAMALALPSCSSAFFVDQGHIDEINGVKFAIEPPFLFVKKAFKLRGENLSAAQLEILRLAMPHIALMTHQILSAENPNLIQDLDRLGVRNIRQLLHLNQSTPLYVKTIQHWMVNTHTIEFTTDYFYSENHMPALTFRDNYRFAQTDEGWQFSGHPQDLPEGFLTCAKTLAGWLRCEK
jgi:hypothetical protein